MTREEIKKAAEVMLAYVDGKKIECGCSSGLWVEVDPPAFNWAENNYRIKPEPKYRPFKTAEECWEEMLKHEPFGFLSNTDEPDYFSICRVFEEKGKPKITFASNPYSDFDTTKVFDKYQFADGTPFGIKEE